MATVLVGGATMVTSTLAWHPAQLLKEAEEVIRKLDSEALQEGLMEAPSWFLEDADRRAWKSLNGELQQNFWVCSSRLMMYQNVI